MIQESLTGMDWQELATDREEWTKLCLTVRCQNSYMEEEEKKEEE